MTFSGSAHRINAALAGMTFLGDADYAGHASVYCGVSVRATPVRRRISDSRASPSTIAPVNDASGQCGSRAQGVDETTLLSSHPAMAMRSSLRCRLQTPADVLQIALTSTNGT